MQLRCIGGPLCGVTEAHGTGGRKTSATRAKAPCPYFPFNKPGNKAPNVPGRAAVVGAAPYLARPLGGTTASFASGCEATARRLAALPLDEPGRGFARHARQHRCAAAPTTGSAVVMVMNILVARCNC